MASGCDHEGMREGVGISKSGESVADSPELPAARDNPRARRCSEWLYAISDSPTAGCPGRSRRRGGSPTNLAQPAPETLSPDTGISLDNFLGGASARTLHAYGGLCFRRLRLLLVAAAALRSIPGRHGQRDETSQRPQVRRRHFARWLFQVIGRACASLCGCRAEARMLGGRGRGGLLYIVVVDSRC